MVMGREGKLHPAIVIVSFLMFGVLLGIVGVLRAVPAAVLCATLLDEWFPDEPLQESLASAVERVREPDLAAGLLTETLRSLNRGLAKPRWRSRNDRGPSRIMTYDRARALVYRRRPISR
jgi:hypothetical protein